MGRPPRRASGGSPIGELLEQWEPAGDDPLWMELEAACGTPFKAIHKDAIREAVNDYRYAAQLEINTGALAEKIQLAGEINEALKRVRSSCTRRRSIANRGVVVEFLVDLEGRARRFLQQPIPERPGQMLMAMALISDEIVRELKAERAEASSQTYARDHFAAHLADLVGAFLGKPQKLTSPRVVALLMALRCAVDLGKQFEDKESAKKALADGSRRLRRAGNS